MRKSTNAPAAREITARKALASGDRMCVACAARPVRSYGLRCEACYVENLISFDQLERKRQQRRADQAKLHGRVNRVKG